MNTYAYIFVFYFEFINRVDRQTIYQSYIKLNVYGYNQNILPLSLFQYSGNGNATL